MKNLFYISEFEKEISRVRSLFENGEFDQAIRLAEHIEHGANQLFRNQPRLYLAHLLNLATLYKTVGDYNTAESRFNEFSVKLRAAGISEEDPLFSIYLNNIGEYYLAVGKFTLAEHIHRQALALKERLFDEKSPEYTTSLNNLASVCSTMGRWREAEDLHKKALRIDISIFGENHPYFATDLCKLGYLLARKGSFEEAENHYQRARQIRAETLGKIHPEYAESLHAIAGIRERLDDRIAAQELYQEALNIQRRCLRWNHPRVADTLMKLADLYLEAGDHPAAESYLQESLSIVSSSLGKDHPKYAEILLTQARILCQQGKYQEAEEHYIRTLEIMRSIFGNHHSKTALVLNDLAVLYRQIGRDREARDLYELLLESFKDLAGELPARLAVLSNLALACALTNREKEALGHMKQLAEAENRLLREVFSITSEKQKIIYSKNWKRHLDIFISLVDAFFKTDPSAKQDAYNWLLNRKGLQTKMSVYNKYISLSHEGKSDSALSRLDELRRKITDELIGKTETRSRRPHRNKLGRLVRERDRIESQISCHPSKRPSTEQFWSMNVKKVAEALPEDTLLVDFVLINWLDLQRYGVQSVKDVSGSFRYFAFVIQAKKPESVKMVDLGDADWIDRDVRHFLDKSIIAQSTDAGGQNLRRQIFDPLELEDCKKVFLCPDGELCRLPFEILPMKNDEYLVDFYYFSYLLSGYDVTRFHKRSKKPGSHSVVVFNPDFNLGNPKPRSRRGNFFFQTLDGTECEGRNVAKMLEAETLSGSQVRKSKIKALRSPRILHIATHGIFLPAPTTDAKELATYEERGQMLQKLVLQPEDEELKSRFGGLWLEDATFRSGLALAGANAWLSSLPGGEEGVLVAEEVIGMDLRETEMVVLSACDSARGDIHEGEGVAGLRRSFLLAGTKTLIVSQWKIPDLETKTLMIQFYNFLKKGYPRSDALRAAQLELKKKYSDPWYWGAFICIGDPGRI